ncbi:hypothetical protein ACFQAS_07125 [Halopenitus salinus]|uniref:Rep protein n=1 Tax=Halopenitus salinus TaxID=1198295 RepID=A0ABD5V055_9EURY
MSVPDDYGPTNGNPPGTRTAVVPEPGDPSTANHATRRKLPLAPPSVKVERLPAPLTDCGEPQTVEEARETYLRTQRASWNAVGRTSKYERHRYHIYPRILEADRHFRTNYENVTTAMLTRRLSPLDETDNWLTPWECNEMLHGGGVHRSVREALNYHLGDFTFEWIAVTAPTRSAGTPHEHIYLWIDDLDDDVTTEHFEPGLEKHLKYCANAYEEDHRYRADGTSGAITVEHTPRIVKQIPDKLNDINDETNSRLLPNTAGAQYLASQLAHLPLGDFYDTEREDPPQALFEGAALAWASPKDWFRSSQGVPAL